MLPNLIRIAKQNIRNCIKQPFDVLFREWVHASVYLYVHANAPKYLIAM